MLSNIKQDLIYAFRTMRQKPAFALTAIFTLALAIGGNTAMFSVIRAVLLKPLPYPDPERLVSLQQGATPSRLAALQTEARTFTGIGAYTGTQDLTLSSGAEPEILQGVLVSARFLQILEVSPLLGRGFRPEEDLPGAPAVAIISAELWRRRFNGDPQIIGKPATFESTPYTIVGVLPPHFRFPYAGLDVWTPAPAQWPLVAAQSRALSPYLTLFGRLKPGISLAQANAELVVIHHRYALAHPTMLDAKPKVLAEAEPMKERIVSDVRAMLWMLFGAVGCVLLIACANVAGLLLARAAGRSREFAVRAALGAARGRLVEQLLIESTLLSLAGGLLGVFLAFLSLRAIPAMKAFALPRASEVHMDGTVLAFAAAVSLVAGLVFGLAPSLGASRPDLISVLRTSGVAAQNTSPRAVSLRSLLSVGQVAISIVLLIGAALLMKSVAQLRHVDVGFNPSNLLTFHVSLPPARYDTNVKRDAFFKEFLRRIESLPGVRAATASMTLPMMGIAGSPVQDASKPLLKLNERPIAVIMIVTRGYVRTLGIRLVRGRDFSEHDTEDGPRVALIDEGLARCLWPEYPAGPDPIGQRLLIGGVNLKPARIVGIVADVHQNLENTAWPRSVYEPFDQNPRAAAEFAVRTAGEPTALIGPVREQLRALDPNEAPADFETMDSLVEAEVGQRRLLSMLLGVFTGVALLLALMGIYGVVAYSVTQRTQEMGIRKALGAQQGDILRLVMGQGFVLAITGIAIGIGGALALTRVLKTMLFQVSVTDPVTFVAVPVMFLLVALAATYLPARRATRVDPMASLRV